MAVMDYLPTNEVLGVFVGISSYDWLLEGQTNVLQAAIVSLAAGAVIGVLRYRRNRRPLR